MAKPLKKSDIVNRTGGVATDDGRTLYGFDAEVYLKMKAQEDPDWEMKIGAWINSVIAPSMLTDVGDLYTSLKDGLFLCELMNKLRPGTIPKWSTKKGRNGQLHPLMERENITLYLEACWKVGVSSDAMFVVADLHGRRGMQAVMTNLAALSNMAPSWGFPIQGVGIKTRKATLPTDLMGSAEQEKAMPAHLKREEEIDVEKLELEFSSLRQQLEECQRTISKLDSAKGYLTEQLKFERKKLSDSEKEVAFLQATGKGAPAPETAKMIDELKRSKEDIHAELQSLKREIGSGLNLSALTKELDDTKAAKRGLEERLRSVGDPLAIERLQQRIKQLTTENMAFMSQAVSGGGIDASVFLKKIAVLEDERNNLVADYEKKIHTLSVKIASVEDEVFKTMCAFEEAKEAEMQQQTRMRAEAQDALRILRQNNALELTKLQNEVESLKTERGVMVNEFNTQKELLEQQIAAQKAELKLKTDEFDKEAAKVKKQKELLAAEQQARKEELEQSLEALKTKYDQQVTDYKAQVEKLAADKLAINEKAFNDQKKVNQELFQKQTELQIALRKASGGEAAGDTEETGLVELERAHLAENHNVEKEKLLQEKISAVDELERSLLDEKRRADNIQLEMEKVKAKMQAEYEAEVQKSEKELEDLLVEIEHLEGQVELAKTEGQQPIKEMNEKIAALTASSVKEKIQLENKIRELEQYKKGLEDEKEALKSRIQNESTALQNKHTQETNKYKAQIEQMEKTAAKLMEEKEYAKNPINALNDQKWSEETNSMRTTLDMALRLLTGQKPGITLEVLQNALAIENKCKALEAEIAKVTKDNSTQKAKMVQQHKQWDAAEQQLKEMKAKVAAGQTVVVQQHEKVSVPEKPQDKPVPAGGDKAKLAAQQKLARQNNRKSTLLYLEKNTVEQDMKKLTETIETLMLGEACAKDAHTAFKGLFKLDNGRRLLCFSLHESSAGCEPGEPFLMNLASFEILKWMLTDVMNNLNLSDGSDQISGRLLLECSALIGRESKKGKEPELLQEFIKPHRVWLNTYFWEEYFWVQVTPKFEELNPETKEDENAFFKVEIIEFAKSMLGWGNLGVYAISLFIESLCDKSDLSEDIKAGLVKELEAYVAQEDKNKKAVTVAPSQSSHRRTVALSHAQIQEALKSPMTSEPGGANWEAQSEDIARRPRNVPRNATTSGTRSERSERSTGRSKGSESPAAIPAFSRSKTSAGKPPPPGTAPPPPSDKDSSEKSEKSSDSKSRRKEDKEFQQSRRKQVAKTVQLSSNGFLANLSMVNNASAYI